MLKRQFEAVGVDMILKEVSTDDVVKALAKQDFEAALFNAVSGPSVFRLYELWHTGGPLNLGQPGKPVIDAALDRIRYAPSDDEYRAAVAGFQKAVADDPPAIFLAWSQSARAVGRRFDVASEPGRDVFTTLRLWRPVVGDKIASRN